MIRTLGLGMFILMSIVVSGKKTACSDNGKDSFIKAKISYDGTTASRIKYSEAVQCLEPAIRSGAISEEELGVAPALKDDLEIPFLTLDDAKPTTIVVSITANSGPQKSPINRGVTYRNWVITGLYAPPGKILTVTSPEAFLSKMKIKIGANTDQQFKTKTMIRDPSVTMDFSITKTIETIGSPYGGLIMILFQDNTLDGTSSEIKLENVLKAPYFIFGKHSNEDWNSHIKSQTIPWTVLEIPNKIVLILPSGTIKLPSRRIQGASNLEDVNSILQEWNTYMDKNDRVAGLLNRPAAEVVVTDTPKPDAVAGAHNGYPIVMYGAIGFPGLIIGHELGHNVQIKGTMISHYVVNLIYYYVYPEKRNQKSGTFGRESRLFNYIKAGKPIDLTIEVSKEDKIDKNLLMWADILKLPFDGTDGSGWKNDGNWDDLPTMFAAYKKMPYEQRDKLEKGAEMDLWVKTYCNVKKMNMVPYFEFWKFPITASTRSICQQYSGEPTEMMSWINNIQKMADEADKAVECPGEEWIGLAKKCFKISEIEYTYQDAQNYCSGLGDSIALASIMNEDDSNLANLAYFKSPFKGVWVQPMANPRKVFPYAQDLIYKEGNQVTLAKYGVTCQYGIIQFVTGGQTKNCIGPKYQPPRKKFLALCEKTL